MFTDKAWEDYEYWHRQDRRIIKRINQLIDDIDSTPFYGIGKPEPLKWELSGAWSRRINDEHRLIYYCNEDNIVILACRYHYNK